MVSVMKKKWSNVRAIKYDHQRGNVELYDVYKKIEYYTNKEGKKFKLGGGENLSELLPPIKSEELNLSAEDERIMTLLFSNEISLVRFNKPVTVIISYSAETPKTSPIVLDIRMGGGE